MPVSSSPARSSAPPSPTPHRRSTSRWPRVLLAGIVLCTSLAAVAYAGLFIFVHGLANLPSVPPSSHSSYVFSGGAAPPAQPRVGALSGPSATLSTGCDSGSHTEWGDSFTVARTDNLCGSVNVYGGNATIDGNVSGNVTVVAGSAIVNGSVNGNVTAIGGDITLGERADVGGNVDALGGTVRKSPEAVVAGNIEHGFTFGGVTPLSWLGFTGDIVMRWWSMLFWGLAGALVAIFFPRQLRSVRSVVRREPVMSFVAGIATVVVGIVVALVLFITCIGIPVALALAVAMWLAWILGTVAIGLWIGEGLLRLGGSSDRSPVLASVMGVLLLTVCESIPCAGGILNLAAGLTGLGASALALLHSRQAAAMRSHLI